MGPTRVFSDGLMNVSTNFCHISLRGVVSLHHIQIAPDSGQRVFEGFDAGFHAAIIRRPSTIVNAV
ncbi:protein of unknown function [Cupriavidus neocaledonicus]|uniref:Uncharacterized protein n=1 Tax=Cupriavidus neocaledonicus TaxID=1040979 RepID=A0A375H9E2_9BURK|nr:protein of unknown function [Cupriavidus neocaledonicus]